MDIVTWPTLVVVATVGMGLLFLAQACFLISDYWKK